MQADADIEVAIAAARFTSPDYTSMVFNLGGRGNAVKLHGIHYTIDYFVVGSPCYLAFALSSNPAHELTPPPTQGDVWEDPALYGLGSFLYSSDFGGTDFGAAVAFRNIVIPLYGLIRPRRIIMVCQILHSNYDIRVRGELYYEPITLDTISLDTLDRKYGKYRRT